MYMEKFDPLAAKNVSNEEVVIKALKREIKNILDSYVGWFDPFCELIQNALDAIDERLELNEEEYNPTIKVHINIKNNLVIVTDNGIGFDEEKYKKFLAPNFSFKSGNKRGHKGVGATYLAYGFNFMQIASKSPEFEAYGTIKDARKWLGDDNPASNPMVEPEKKDIIDTYFKEIDRGTSICVKFDQHTTPKDLSWIQLRTAQNWLSMLRIKTGLGAMKADTGVQVEIEVVDKTEEATKCNMKGIKYLWIDELTEKCGVYSDIIKNLNVLHEKYGADYRIPAKYSNLKAIHDFWDFNRISSEIKLDSSETDMLEKHKPQIYFCYVYSLIVWGTINKNSGIRSGQSIFQGGIQLGADNMPQGDLIQIPLTKNIGRQKQAHFYIHFDNCVADLGRKGFQKEICDFAKEISKKILDQSLRKVAKCLKRNTGAAIDLVSQRDLDIWKREMTVHEEQSPLEIKNENFFIPTKQISITSLPTREQDIIALFNQLIAGGVIRGIKIMATNEAFRYDGLYKVSIIPPSENQIYDSQNNPLGVDEEIVEEIFEDSPDGFIYGPKVLEYKFMLDGLIKDISNGVKIANDIDLVVAWDSGDLYREKYYITSLLIDDNRNLRQYHGITHLLNDYNTEERVCDMILLKDLVEFLNNPDECTKNQEKYDN